MPSFDPIGFWLPACVATLYLYRAAQHWRSRNVLYLGAIGFLTYVMPLRHANGVGFVPLYALIVFAAGYQRENQPRWWPEPVPLAALLPYAFASIAVPDFLLTWRTGGALWTVGGAQWQDGLLRFWLYLIPLFAAVRLLFDFAHAVDARQAFDVRLWVIEQLSPWPHREPARSLRC